MRGKLSPADSQLPVQMIGVLAAYYLGHHLAK
jgi:hypothetical protein